LPEELAKPFDVLAQEIMFDPIGMKETSHFPKEWYVGRLPRYVGKQQKQGKKQQ
jgi:hypothetical protein